MLFKPIQPLSADQLFNKLLEQSASHENLFMLCGAALLCALSIPPAVNAQTDRGEMGRLVGA